MTIFKRSIHVLIGICFTISAFSQQIVIAEKPLMSSLKSHISILASDKFEGRETGTKGEELSYAYIIKQFKSIGLLPKGTSQYLQEFSFNAGSVLGKNNRLKINNVSFKAEEDFYPIPYSSQTESVKGKLITVGSGLIAPTLGRDDYADKKELIGKVFILDFATPEGDNPHSKWAEFADTRKRIDDAISKGAAGIIFINSNNDISDPKQNTENKITPVSVPVIFVKANVAMLIISNEGADVELAVDVQKITRTGHNVIGYLDNKKENTIIIGAHYDHLGFGGAESLYRGKKAIHNGADDNASGTASLIELAKYLKSSSLTNYNFLFIAFSGEEKGLLGSNHFVKEPTIDLKKVNYMLNMDMVGRLKPEEQTLLINGTGTSPQWNDVMKNNKVEGLKIKTTESGVGPSDHTSFYLSNIPVLHFFSGTHSDYHKPSDDEPLINYGGMVSIIKYMLTLIENTNPLPQFSFTKTNDASNEEAPRFKVTLGVVPDYAFEGSGMKIDGVTEGKPAAHAGLQKGDIVIQLGDIKVVDMMSYMKALSKFKKGETTKVKVLRGSVEKEADITF
jgi:hypothetical protein